jgi:hypothetical protein
VEKEAGVKQFHFFLEGDVSLTGSRILHKSEDLIRNARFLLCGPDSCPLSGLPPHPVGFIGGTPRRPFLQPGFCKMPFGFASQRGLLSFSRSTQCKGRAFPPAVPYPCGDKSSRRGRLTPVPSHHLACGSALGGSSTLTELSAG